MVAAFTAVAVAGILAGTWLVWFVPQAALERAFAMFLRVMGAVMLRQNRDALPTRPTSAAPTAPAD